MKSMRKTNRIFMLIILLLFISIGYAFVNGDLKINGTATVTKQTWDVHFENIQITTGSVTPVHAAVINPEATTEVSYEVHLDNPGDFYEFEVDAVNSGSIDAMITNISSTNNGNPISLPSYMNYSITYADGIPVENNQLLAKAVDSTHPTKETYKVRLEFRSDINASDLVGISQLNLRLKFEVTFAPTNEDTILKPYVLAQYDTPNAYTVTIPYEGDYEIELWGASGGSYANQQPANTGVNTIYGGKGAYTKGTVHLEKNKVIYFYVGEIGVRQKQTLGFNGGGHGGTSAHSGTGGSATDVRLTNGNWDDFSSLKSRIMVAAGGGAPYGYGYGGTGGAGGGLTGYKGNVGTTTGDEDAAEGGTGATQTSAGLGGDGYDPVNSGHGLGSAGFFGIGGSNQYSYGGGGASGYYGGGSGGAHYSRGGSGGGGSSFISGHNGCNAITEESTSSNIVHTGNSEHYSKYKFSETLMIDGKGCKWTNVLTNDCSGQIQPDGTIAVGHVGDGYARITAKKIYYDDTK